MVVRSKHGRLEVLAFRHPDAGLQLVKGTVEAGETILQAAERELFEESGINGNAVDDLGAIQMLDPEQEWHFVVCRTGQLEDTWTHRTADGGGLDFDFFWHPLNEAPDEQWHPVFKRALGFLREHVAKPV